MRSTDKEITDDTLNRCFVCSIPRETFERHNIVFQDHIKRDHNMWQVKYFVSLFFFYNLRLIYMFYFILLINYFILLVCVLCNVP